MGFLRHLPGASFKNVFWITILFLSVSYSQQYVESILYESPPKRPTKDCKDCDIVQLPDGSYFFNKCDPYSKEKCGLDNLKDYDCCVGYQLKRKSRLLMQPRNVCKNDSTPWSRCLEQMTVNTYYRPYVKTLKEMFMNGKLKMDQKYTVFIVKGKEPDVDNKETGLLTVVKGKFFSHDMYEGLSLSNALLADQLHYTSRGGLKLFMDCIEVLETDKECPNGVVHMISQPIKARASKDKVPCDGGDGGAKSSGECDTSGRLVTKGPLPKCLEPYRVDKWWEYLKECDLYRDDDKDYSLLFPTNDAFDESRDYMSDPWYRQRYDRFLKEKDYRCEVLRYHVFLIQKTPNLATAPEDLPYAYRTNNRGDYAPLWECVSKSKAAEAGKDVSFNRAVLMNEKKPVQYKAAAIFITNRVNMIPDQNITELVKSRDNMKVYTQIQTEGNSKKYFGEDPPNNVHLVVNDTGIKLEEVDSEYYDKFIRLHTMNVPCTNINLLDDKEDSFTNGLGFPLITRVERSDSDPKKFTVYIGYEGLEKVKWSKVVRYEGPTRDGAVWSLDKPLICPEPYCPVKTKTCDLSSKIDYKGKLPECLIPYSVDRWWNYLKECDLYMEDGKRYHVLFPVNSALDWWSEYKPFQPEYTRFMNDKEYRCAVVRYHIMYSEKEPTINFPKINETVHFLSNNRQPYSPVWQSLYFAPTELVNQGQTEYKYHYGRVMDQTPFTFSRSWITRLDKVIMLPERNITDFLKSRSDLSITYNLVKKTDMGKYFEMNAPKTLYLVERNAQLKELFDEEVRIQKPIPEIPTHEASDSQKVDELKNAYRDSLDATFNQGYAYNFSLWHTIPNYLWGGDIGYYELNQLYYLENARNFEFMVRRVNIDGKDVLKIGYEELPFANWSTVIEFNHYARDGMVWVLDKRLTCPDKQCIPNVKLDVDIYTLTVAACRSEDLAGKEVDKATFSKKMDVFADQFPEDCTNIFVNDYKNIGIVED